ncbi:MAG: NADPH-dependent 7-cyano-7-deazaguanine reductase QueF [Gammaproteobacteria bacterium RIFCSPHIGHO2_12_FULL_45_12]|nr:MAG: NADPH-dependent 7-cyano-7-deazaguanine reductase QueF [Gammaproteobacteria bacterium RIFCSPHIGHO2_12_FULL_45_12]
MNKNNITPEQSELGKKAEYDPHYNPDKLFSISRKGKRDEIGVPDNLPFFGFDLWNHYEVSWLNEKGKPVVALAEISYGCETPCIIESKSMKLYFNSFNHTNFKDKGAVQAIVKKDIEERVGGAVSVKIIPLSDLADDKFFVGFNGECLDKLDVECSSYMVEPSLLKYEEELVDETLFSNLLKSNCLVTNQPDWGSVQISYKGKKINREGLLRYIVSFRNHNEFHEQCIERMFMDIMKHCHPEALTVYGRYTRRGGIDINPWRSTKHIPQNLQNARLYRQ